ncbi:MAG: helix-turn-helix domain-containing protein [Clostridia bacterium]|nr:helix-turn-helix domain-containing protein [Clostridia bacterium]
MDLLIGSNIRRLRREKDLTQEELAEHLGISFQAISRWERSEGYPDITMLPVLAAYFDTTVDELMGINETKRQRRYHEINCAWREEHDTARTFETTDPECAADGHRRNIVRMRTALNEFPLDPLMMQQLSSSLHRLSIVVDDGLEYLRQAVEVEEKIIRYCEDCEVRGATLQNLCYSYEKLGEHDKAVEQAKKLTNMYKARENTLVFFVNGDERRNVARGALTPLMWALSVHMKALAEEENAPEYLDKLDEIIDIVLEIEDNEEIRKRKRA